MTIKSLKVMCRMSFIGGQVVRLWQGSGPYIDPDGHIWRCCTLADETLDVIESAINAEAWEMQLSLSRVDKEVSDLAWQDHQDGQVIGSKVEFLIQPCDADDQPAGFIRTHFTGLIDDIEFDEAAVDEKIVATVTVSVRNRFALRKRVSGAVLSDADQQARSAVLNPGAAPDRFCQRIPIYAAGKTIRWPAWS